MAKGYWIARVDVRDSERYKDYVSTDKPDFDRFGANFHPHRVSFGATRHRLL